MTNFWEKYNCLDRFLRRRTTKASLHPNITRKVYSRRQLGQLTPLPSQIIRRKIGHDGGFYSNYRGQQTKSGGGQAENQLLPVPNGYEYSKSHTL